MSSEDIKNKLTEKGLKVTPQRMAILEAIYNLKNHPTAENIIDYIKKMHPNIATGTVYKVLGALVDNRLVKKVKTENDIMRYDGVMKSHHHLYCMESDVIKDYVDEELDELLQNYFEKKNLPGFKIEDIVLQVKGTFNK
ncbi:transcriptional repressor [Labilibaculum sp. A4]|uniref:Transcriptional repressor n=1 Tax=Labilibaculum euxinus TaxID=2686357 RepID=A0A425YF64_9BACT|nr:Fur family transcriptional regulator [Labilibaculum euxinus]MDQ1770506.1 Fur family transcriptional regulator [Labilibaculum euxinus]MUP38712.1 transcriptional repressor [Labilibaculum euxinus]MVB07917.1 transcriptional repressor [Labilibaculum euxinus]MWN75275.1 transcriptional repressor [Labilibaculum euxinus]